MREVIEELKQLKRCFDDWASLPGRHRSGTNALELVEEPLRAFFEKGLPEGVRIGKGGRPANDPKYPSDLDIVVDKETADWRLRFRMDVHVAPVLAHLDVASRSDWDRGKLEDDLERAQRTIDDARALNRKTWTGLVAIGDGFRSRSNDITSVIHEFHHTRNIGLWESGNAGSVWPFVDAIIVPGMLLKKHDLFVSVDTASERGPVIYPFPVGGPPGLEELWPLVTARAFFASFLRKVMNHEDWNEPAWAASDTSILLGGAPSTDRWREEWRVTLLKHDTPPVLQHWTGDEDAPWQEHVVHDDIKCSAGCSCTMLPHPALSLTSKRREELLRICEQDPRWYRIGAPSGTIVALDFPIGLEREAHRIASAAFALGFRAEAHRRFVKNATAPADDLAVEIEFTEAVGVDPLGQAFSELRTLLAPGLAHTARIAPEFQLPLVKAWLEQNRGPGRWSLDEQNISAKRIGAAVVFQMVEEVAAERLFLLVLGDLVEQLSEFMDNGLARAARCD